MVSPVVLLYFYTTYRGQLNEDVMGVPMIETGFLSEWKDSTVLTPLIMVVKYFRLIDMLPNMKKLLETNVKDQLLK